MIADLSDFIRIIRDIHIFIRIICIF